ncbi:MAG: ribbon-helix-helix protein, CopG family [Ilumatobacter sp.]|nr:ribbon-helix-helix protein, CopG family [Ilumatobacter sp.]
MKVSISLPDEDVEFLDAYTADHGMPSRSAAVHKAVRLLRASGLGAAYEDAWADWADSDESELWGQTTGDGTGR